MMWGGRSGSYLLLLMVCGTASAQHLKFSEGARDVGVVPREGVDIEHTFTIENTGKEDLVIEQIRSSCACLGSRMEKHTVRPGETSSVRVTFRPVTEYGTKTYTLFFVTNDPDARVRPLTMTARVVAILSLSPEDLVFDLMATNRSASVTNILAVQNIGTNKVFNLKVQSFSPYVRVKAAEVPNEIGSGQTRKYVLEVDAKLQPTASQTGYVRVSGRADGLGISRAVPILLNRDKVTALDRKQSERPNKRSWACAPEVIKFVRTADGYRKSEQLLRIVSTVPDSKFSRLDVVSLSPYVTVAAIDVPQDVKGFAFEYKVGVDPKHMVRKPEQCLLQVRGVVGAMTVNDMVSVQIESR